MGLFILKKKKLWKNDLNVFDHFFSIFNCLSFFQIFKIDLQEYFVHKEPSMKDVGKFSWFVLQICTYLKYDTSKHIGNESNTQKRQSKSQKVMPKMPMSRMAETISYTIIELTTWFYESSQYEYINFHQYFSVVEKTQEFGKIKTTIYTIRIWKFVKTCGELDLES